MCSLLLSPHASACTSEASSAFAAMGYTIRTDRWRYTLWVKWDGQRLKPAHPEQVVGGELYDHHSDTGRDTDAPYEAANLAGQPRHAVVQAQLRVALKAGWKAARPPQQY